MGRNRALLGLAAALVVTGTVAGCGGSTSSDSPRTPETAEPLAADPGFGHVHGLGVNPADGELYAASHYGLWRVPADGPPVRVADRYQDTMGFTVAGPGHFLASGHPDPREDQPAHLGLIESRDLGQTWTPLSLHGEADFHALEAEHGHVYGYDSTSGTFMVSADGLTWQRRSQGELYDFTVSPEDPDVVLAGTPEGLVASADGGDTFAPLPGAPALVFLDWSPAGLYGLDAGGTTWSGADGGASWQRRSSLGTQPSALTVTETGVLAAGADGIYRSEDQGRSFRPVVRFTAGH